jgi:hypothetical protein
MSNKSSEIVSFEAGEARAACKCDRIGCNFTSLIKPNIGRDDHTPVINSARTKVACSSTCHAVRPPPFANDTSRAPFPDTRLLDHRIAQTRFQCHLKRLVSSLQRRSRGHTIGTFLGYLETGVSNRAVLVWCTSHYVHTPDARCPALQRTIARMILRRTNQKFDMPEEIGHDECLRQVAVGLASRTRDRSGSHSSATTALPPKVHQWTPWVPREYASVS